MKAEEDRFYYAIRILMFFVFLVPSRSGCAYVTRYRLDKACSMLREGTSVTEAALACGFHGSSYFAEVFKRTWQITPREYQRSFRQRSAPE